MPHGIVVQTCLGAGLIPWSSVQSLRVDETEDEVTLHLEGLRGGKVLTRSLTCRRGDVTPDALAALAEMMRDKGFL